jgi:hypothetical protein
MRTLALVVLSCGLLSLPVAASAAPHHATSHGKAKAAHARTHTSKAKARHGRAGKPTHAAHAARATHRSAKHS